MPGFGAQLPMPSGAAGAPPDLLALAAQGLAGQMGIQPTMAGGYLPTMGQTPISTAAQQEDRQQTFLEESFLETMGLSREQMAQAAATAEMQAANALQIARTAASASAAAAGTSAAAQMAVAETNARAAAETAQTHANAMRAVAEMDTKTRLQIANIQAEVERERTGVMRYEAETGRRIQESREFGQPINLAAYIHYMTQGPGTVTPAVLPGQTGLPQAAQAPAAPTAANAMAGLYQQGMAGGPVGVVGEGGPEVLNAIPGGIQVTPTTQPQAQALKQQGVPGMQGGGGVRFSMTRGATQPVISRGGVWQRNPAILHPTDAQALQQQNVQRAQRGHQPLTPERYTGIQQAARQREEETPPAWFTQWQAAQGAQAMPGAAAGAGTPGAGTGATPQAATPGAGTPVTPGTTGDQDTDWQAFINQLYGNAPAYGWSGPTTLPQIGVDIPYLPFQQNLPQWGALPSQVQQGRLSMWRALGITPETAMGMMTQAAPTGIAQPVAGWG